MDRPRQHQTGEISVKGKLYAWTKFDRHYEIRDHETGEFVENADSLTSFRIDKEAE